jgi:hypothetical protein
MLTETLRKLFIHLIKLKDMATQKKSMLLGRAGELSFKELNGKNVVSKPADHVNQTPQTINASLQYGNAVRLASQIRFDMDPILNDKPDPSMSTRLSNDLNLILRHACHQTTKQYHFKKSSFERLNGFEFNTNSPFSTYVWLKPEVSLIDNRLTVGIPELVITDDLIFPEKATDCILRIVINLYALKEAYQRNDMDELLEIKFNQGIVPAQTWHFELPDGCLCIVGIGLEFFRLHGINRTIMQSIKLNPAAICGAVVTPGTFVLPVNTDKYFSSILWNLMDLDLYQQEAES